MRTPPLDYLTCAQMSPPLFSTSSTNEGSYGAWDLGHAPEPPLSRGGVFFRIAALVITIIVFMGVGLGVLNQVLGGMTDLSTGGETALETDSVAAMAAGLALLGGLVCGTMGAFKRRSLAAPLSATAKLLALIGATFFFATSASVVIIGSSIVLGGVWGVIGGLALGNIGLAAMTPAVRHA